MACSGRTWILNDCPLPHRPSAKRVRTRGRRAPLYCIHLTQDNKFMNMLIFYFSNFQTIHPYYTKEKLTPPNSGPPIQRGQSPTGRHVRLAWSPPPPKANYTSPRSSPTPKGSEHGRRKYILFFII